MVKRRTCFYAVSRSGSCLREQMYLVVRVGVFVVYYKSGTFIRK